MKKLIIICIAVLLPPLLFCQAQIVFNGADIVIANGAQLVIANPNSNALTSLVAAGGIVSEGENNNVVWMIGNNAGSYTVPFIFGSNNRPLSFTTSGAAGNGVFTLSTYGKADWKNSNYLPSDVLNVNRNGSDNSNHVIDRFWKIDASGYTTKPSLTNLAFSYNDKEWNESGNVINEAGLAAQRWNSNANRWSDFSPSGTDDAATNTVTVASVNANDLYPWWTLVDSSFALPVQLISFTASADKVFVLLDWKTASEINTNYFTVEKTNDMSQIVTAGNVPAAGNSVIIQDYSLKDKTPFAGTSFYRLKTIDKDGRFSYSQWRPVIIGTPDKWQVYPNPATDKIYITGNVAPARTIQMQLINANGSIIQQQIINNQTTTILLSHLAEGSYIIRISDGGNISTFKIIKR